MTSDPMFTNDGTPARAAKRRDISGMKEPAGPAPRRYWVVGGVYSDTQFDEIAGDQTEERYGPFRTFAQAKEEWARLAWRSVDDCHARYRVTVEMDAAD